VVSALAALAATVAEHAEELGRIDAVAGDGDHGIGMGHGSTAAYQEALAVRELGAGAGTVLDRAADAWSDRAGGTSGALWGAMLRSLGTVLGDQDRPTAASVAEGVTAASDAVRRMGGAEVGDKTMVDVLVPFAGVLAAGAAAGDPLPVAWDRAATAAEEAAAATADLLPRKGRARPHAEKSLGTPDAGAHSLALIVRALHAVLLPDPR
jgi:dihydroxyacetone kinase